MPSIKSIRTIAIFVLLLTARFAMAHVLPKDSGCIELGDRPSLMVKLVGHYSNTAKPKSLSLSNLQRLSQIADVQLTSTTPMALGMFVITFKPTPSFNGCYPKDYLDNIKKQMITAHEASYVAPNALTALDDPTPQRKKQSLPTLTPPGFDSIKQWDLSSNQQVGGTNAISAWDITTGSKKAVVAVLDTGVLENTSLSPNLLTDDAASFFNGGSIAANANAQCPSCGGADHGTHVAGTVASSGNGAYGQHMYGLNYEGRVLPVNIFSKFSASECEGVTGQNKPCLLAILSDVLDAQDWLSGTPYAGLPAAPKVVIINMSISGQTSCDTPMQEMRNRLYNQNIAVVVAAGNSNTDVDTDNNCTKQVVVAATGPTNKKAFYSSWGNAVTISAPGGDMGLSGANTGILSTVEDGYGQQQGTSMASPHVAGVLGLEFAANPGLTAAQAYTALKMDPRPLAVGEGTRSCASPRACGVGIVNAYAAVKTAAQYMAPVLTTAVRNPLKLSQAWVAYTDAGSVFTGRQLSSPELPDTTVTYDAANKRFVIDNIQTAKSTKFTIVAKNGNATGTSNTITLPGILQ